MQACLKLKISGFMKFLLHQLQSIIQRLTTFYTFIGLSDVENGSRSFSGKEISLQIVKFWRTKIITAAIYSTGCRHVMINVSLIRLEIDFSISKNIVALEQDYMADVYSSFK